MYFSAHFEETKVEVLHDLIVTRPLATLVTMSSNDINANHIPLNLVEKRGQYETLQGDVAPIPPVDEQQRIVLKL